MALSTLQTVSTISVNTIDEIMEYFKIFGYFGESSVASDMTDESSFVKKMLRQFQYNAGLNQTGVFDNDTHKMMNTPRCGQTDEIGGAKRRRRYVLQGSKWRSTDLTYGFMSYSTKLSDDIVRTIFHTAFSIWANASALTFTLSSGDSYTIGLLFATGYHGDQSPFDGPGGVLAHAFFPDSGGEAHFDDDESWTYQNPKGTDLLQVAIHEIGHTVGLAHTNVKGAIMYPFYTGYTPNPHLTDDDIKAIQILYGAPKQIQNLVPSVQPPVAGNTQTTAFGQPMTTTTSPSKVGSTTKASQVGQTTTSAGKPESSTTSQINAVPVSGGNNTNLCINSTIDAIVVAEGQTYVFKGLMYYILNATGIMPGYPQPIKSLWSQVEGPISTALYYDPTFQFSFQGVTYDPGHLFLFQGSSYWRFENINQLSPGYPRLISTGFKGVPDNPDAAFIWSGNGRIFFIKGNQYYRYTRGVGTDYGYPRPLSVWTSLPSRVDSAFQWTNGRTYFFSGTQYYRFNDRNFKVDTGFPRPTGPYWFGCGSSNLEKEVSYTGDQFNNVAVSTISPGGGNGDFNYNDHNTASSPLLSIQCFLGLLFTVILNLSKFLNVQYDFISSLSTLVK